MWSPSTARLIILSDALSMEDDPIIISSSNDSTPIFCTTKSKAVPRKKKAKYILVSDSREDEVAVNVNERAVDVGLVGEADTYEEPGPSLKRKAKELQTMRPVKKSACTPELKPEKMASKKGKQHALGHVLRNAEDSSAESDFPDILMPQGAYLSSMTPSFTYIRSSSNMWTSLQGTINGP